ncbi:MAG TPA: hypothetical protein EYO73_11465 [Sulfurimonas sp.]|nr:hypothetical protein [Sulfurimonas sp.]
MQNNLLLELREGRESSEKKVLASISKCIYQYERYGINFSLALGMSKDLEAKKLVIYCEKQIR